MKYYFSQRDLILARNKNKFKKIKTELLSLLPLYHPVSMNKRQPTKTDSRRGYSDCPYDYIDQFLTN